LGTPDSRWFRIKGTNTWVPSGYIFGNPEGLPGGGGGGGGGSVGSVTNPLLTRQNASYFNARPQFYTTGNIFAQGGVYGSSLVGGRGYTEGNCTWYAHGRVKELGGNAAALNSMSGNANQWHTQLSNGTKIVSSPRPGDIAQWTRWYTDSRGVRRQMNHVAVVEKVNGNGTIVISESHWKSEYNGSTYTGYGKGTLHNVRTIQANNPDRYIRVPGVKVGSGDSGDENDESIDWFNPVLMPIPNPSPSIDYTRFHKALDYMYKEMKTNIQSGLALTMKSWWSFTPTKPAALAMWAATVKGRSEWDHKRWDKLPKAANINVTNHDDLWFPIQGDNQFEYYYDIWSNIHYGYVGSSIGFDAGTLQTGALIDDVLKWNLDPSDIASIQLGIYLWETYGNSLTKEILQTMIWINRSYFNREPIRDGK